jgi:IS5 family transposase
MKQAALDLSLSVKKTRKREFLDQMDKVVPWASTGRSDRPVLQ